VNYEVNLIPSDKPASAKPASSMIPCSAKAAAIPSPSDKGASSEINLCHAFGILSAQIIQYCIDALMIALNCCAWPVQLQDAR
jgi:hypothetical protein